MTPVLMEFLTSTGQPLGMANVEIRLSRSDFDEEVSGIIMPRLINAVTGLDGKLLIDLMPCDSRYHVTVYDTVSDTALHYHFYVPHLNTPGTIVRLQDLIVADDAVIDPVSYDVTAMLTILDAKANVLAAISRGELARDRAEAAAQFADDSIEATTDARNAAQTAALQVQVDAAQVAIDKQNVHDNTLLTEDRAAVVLQSKVDVLAAATASLASATEAAVSAASAADAAYAAEQSDISSLAARDAAAVSAASSLAARDAGIAAQDVTETARDITLAARDITTAARDVVITNAMQLAGQLHAFNEIYLGKFAVPPTVDGNGGVLKVGAIYEDTVEGKIYQWESDLSWHAYDEESQLQLNNATLAASNAAASAASALALKNAAADSATAAANSATVTAGLVTAAADSASASLASQNMAAQSVVDANAAKVTAIDAKDTATAKAAEAASYATQVINGVLSTVLGGLSTASSLVISASDSVLAAFGKLQSQISLRAMKDNAVLTGTPTAPTAPTGTATDQLSTTMFVKNATDGKVDKTILAGNNDLNSIIETGFYRVENLNANLVHPYSQVIVSSGAGTVAQMSIHYGNGTMAVRAAYGVPGESTWTPWRTLLADHNFNSYAPTLTGVGASGTWNINVEGYSKAIVDATGGNVMWFNWSGKNGTPVWLWGGNSPDNMYVFSPAELNVGNSATLGGYYADQGIAGDTIVKRTPEGYVNATYLNTNQGTENTTVAHVYTNTGSDGYLRKTSIAHVTENLSGTAPINITGNAASSSALLPSAILTTKQVTDALKDQELTARLTTARSTGSIAKPDDISDAFVVQSDGGANGAFMTFIRKGVYAVNFGLDESNNLSVGGYSMGAVSYKIWHSGNLTPSSGGEANTVVKLDSNANALIGNYLVAKNLTSSAQSLSFDADKPSGLYHYDNVITGTTPDGAPNYRTIEVGHSNRYTQIAMPYNADKMFFRRKIDATWHPWREVWHTGNMQPPSIYATPNSTVQRDANGSIVGTYINMSDDGNPESNATPVTAIITKKGDNYYRSASAASVKQFLGITGKDVYTNREDLAYDVSVATQMRWANYGNSHTIFDASKGVTPTGAACNPRDSDVIWTSGSGLAICPTLMGYNGVSTYGVRVDSARRADSANRPSDDFLNQDYTWRGVQGFIVNKGSGSYGVDNVTYTMMASNDGGAAGLSFHRMGSWATSMALDPDNVIRMGGWSAGGEKFSFNMNNADFTAQGNIIAHSDERLKTNWRGLSEDFVERWATVKHGVYDRTDTGERQVGLGAQSVQPILPDAVTRDTNGILGLNYGNAAAVATVKLAQRCVQLEELLRTAIDRIEILEKKVRT